MYTLPFFYNERKKEYTFIDITNDHEGATVHLSLGTFVIQFLNTDIESIYDNSLDWHNGYMNYIFDLIHSVYYNAAPQRKLFNEWISDLKNGIIDCFIKNKDSLNFEYFLSERSSIKLMFRKYADANEFYSYYEVNDLESLLTFECVKLKENEIVIKQCANCGKYFIPSNRSDEIYCDNIFHAGKTCKQVGYEEKEKKDPFKSLYTKARKTQHARIRYNIKNKPDYREDHYEPWKKAAEQARDYYKKQNDIDGFQKWIEDNKNAF